MNIVIWLQDNHPEKGGVEHLQLAVGILDKLYGNITVIGAVTPPGLVLKGVRSLAKADLKNFDYDLILVTGKDNSILHTSDQSNFVKLLNEAKNLDIDTDKIVLDRVVCIPFFTLEKYNNLRHSQISILSMNCFAGLIYHRLGLPFLSPIINMFTSDEDFLKFLKDPKKNVNEKPEFVCTKHNDTLDIDYPVYKIGETEWEMNHYSNAEFALQKWQERSKRINWFNLFVTMYTENPKVLEEFDKLPYAKKVCFVPFESNLDSAYYVDSRLYKNGHEFWRIPNGIADGNVQEFDIWDMLLYGKKTPLTLELK